MDKKISGLQKPSWLGRMVNGLVAAVLLIVIVGSMVLVYSHLHAQTSTSSGNPGVQATATAFYPQQTAPNAAATVTNGGRSLTWVIGQDTYWANQRYHQLTGFWVAWTGNADQWVAGARAAGWMVSQKPHIPSIIVLMPGVQGAGNFGHVAVAEAINANGTVHTSNMDWYSNGGGWNRISSANFAVGEGVYFIWHP